jgi:hypothetical protein
METTINCPYCEDRKGTPDTNQHLYVYGDGRGVHCFRCEFHRNREIPDLVLSLIEGTDVSIVLQEKAPEGTPVSITEELKFARPADQFSRAVKYLQTRVPIRLETIRAMKLLYAPWGKYAERIIFPMWKEEGKIGYFVARTLNEKAKPKYLNAPVEKDGWIYPVFTGNDSGLLVVVEGVFDAMAVASTGTSAVALLGKRVNHQQLLNILHIANMINVKHVAVLLDADALHSSIDVAYKLSFYLPTVRKDLPAGVDPCSLLADSGAAVLRYTYEESSSELRTALTGVDNEEPKYRGIKSVARTGKHGDKRGGRKRGQGRVYSPAR